MLYSQQQIKFLYLRVRNKQTIRSFSILFKIKNLPGIATVLCIFVLGTVLYSPQIPHKIFRYDESDYAYAASQGFAANYLNKNEISLKDFITKGVDHVRSKNSALDISDYIRQSDDITFYRHFHAPFYYYLLSFTNRLGLQTEVKYRLVSLFLLLLTVAACFLGLRSLPISNACEMAIISSSLFFCNIVSLDTATYVSPHNAYNLFCIVCLLFLCRLYSSFCFRDFYCCIIALVFAFLSLEYAPVLFLTVVFGLFLIYKELKTRYSATIIRKNGAIAIVLFLLIIALFWPPAFYNLSIVKSYLMFIYYAIFRGGDYGSYSLIGLAIQHFKSSPVLFSFYLLGIISFVVALLKRKGFELRVFIPLLIYSAFFF